MIKSRKKTIYTVFLTVVILVTLVFSAVSYGWLVNYIRGDFGFSAKKLDTLRLEIARITVEKPAPEVYDETNRTTYKECENSKIEANADGTHLDVALGNMSFGAIDNVAQLKPENVVYLRLTVPKSLGDTVKVNLHYSVDDFIVLYKNVYDADGNVTGRPEVTDTDILNNLLAVEGEAKANDSFLLYDVMVSNDDYQAPQIAENFVSSLKKEQPAAETEPSVAQETYQKFVTDTVYQADCAAEIPLYTQTLVNPNYESIAEEGNYYVYIKIVPNLAVLGYSIEYISDIMPCYMYFKISATFEAGPFSPQENPAV